MIQTQLQLGWKPQEGLRRRAVTGGNGGYLARTADLRTLRLHLKPRVTRKLVAGSPLWQFVLSPLRRRLSPAQIASTLAHMPVPVRISHETLYGTFYALPHGEL